MKKQAIRTSLIFMFMILFITTGCELFNTPKDEIPPSEVTGVSVIEGHEKLTLSWKEPSNVDFDKVIISYDGNKTMELKKGVSSKVITGLVNGKEYTFTIRTVDINGNKSKGITIKGKPKFNKVIPEVSNLSATTADKKITLSWTSPADKDFLSVIVLYDKNGKDSKDKNEVKIDIDKSEGENGSYKKEITGLTNDNVYQFTVKTIDKRGKISPGVTKDVSLYKLTDEPQEYGNKVLFGDWPQSLKEENVTVSTSAVTINKWDNAYYGSDGYYYIKPATEKIQPNSEGYKFNNGTPIVAKNVEGYYFKLEPIEWDVLTGDYEYDTDLKGKLLLSKNVLAASVFHAESNKYEGSTVKTYLVENILAKGFVEASKEKIADTKKDKEFGASKVFLLNDKEITNKSYGFASGDVQDNKRAKKTTDYARAIGVYVETDETYYLNNSGWWLRSSNPESAGANTDNNVYVHNVFSDGTLGPAYVNVPFGGVVPAIVLPAPQASANPESGV